MFCIQRKWNLRDREERNSISVSMKSKIIFASLQYRLQYRLQYKKNWNSFHRYLISREREINSFFLLFRDVLYFRCVYSFSHQSISRYSSQKNHFWFLSVECWKYSVWVSKVKIDFNSKFIFNEFIIFFKHLSMNLLIEMSNVGNWQTSETECKRRVVSQEMSS